jgi:hypothetical protein
MYMDNWICNCSSGEISGLEYPEYCLLAKGIYGAKFTPSAFPIPLTANN